jgi:hypothetical protein
VKKLINLGQLYYSGKKFIFLLSFARRGRHGFLEPSYHTSYDLKIFSLKKTVKSLMTTFDNLILFYGQVVQNSKWWNRNKLFTRTNKYSYSTMYTKNVILKTKEVTLSDTLPLHPILQKDIGPSFSSQGRSSVSGLKQNYCRHSAY